MDATGISNPLRNFVYEKFPLAKQRKISDADDLLASGVVDSLGILEIVTFLEKQFGLVISDEELVPENFRSIQELSTFVQSKMSAAGVK